MNESRYNEKRYFRVMVWIGIILLIGIVTGLTTFGFNKSAVNKVTYSLEEGKNSYSLITDEYIIRMYTSAWNDVVELGYNDAYEFLTYCLECIQYVSDRTGKKEWMNELSNRTEDGKAIISIFTVKGVNSQVRFPEGNVYLNMQNKQHRQEIESTIAHELTHMVMGEIDEGTLSEGFATYMEYMEFGNGNFEICGININVLLQNVYLADEYKDLTQDILEMIGAAYDPYVKYQEYGWVFYVYAGSYVYYLVSNYGMEAVVGIFDAAGSDAAYISFTGKDMLTLKAEWLEDLQQYNGEMSIDEIRAILSE